jgi:hypothetical protein
MTKQDPWFFEERAVAFASLVLTKRGDVKVHAQAGGDRAIDLLVEVRKGGRSTLRFFGVQILPCMDLPDAPGADERALAHPPSDAAFPICVFMIGVRQPEGIYRWALEPVVDAGQAALRRAEGGAWHRLDEAGAARLIDQVNAWYDARNNGDVTPQPRGRRSKSAG